MAKNDPFWLKAKYSGVDKNGNKFERGTPIFYYPLGRVILAGDDAKAASSEFELAKFDEDFLNQR